jgi:hypothetical protein
MPSFLTILRRPGHRGAGALAALLAAVALLVAGFGAAAGSADAAIAAKPKPSKAKKKHKKPKFKWYYDKKRVLTIVGTPRADQLALRLKAGKPSKLQIDVGNNGSADFTVNRRRFNKILVFARAGNDLVLIDEANGVFTDTEATSIYGQAGNDDLRGGSGREKFFGGTENDAIDGNRGDDVAFLGAGDDSFTWDPGDGSDVVEGQAGSDSLLFNGAGVAENFDVSANGSRVRFFRNIANITMDLDDVERIAVEALGGADNAVVNDMSGTDLTKVDLDLEGVLNSGAGDGAADTVTVNGTNAPDNINIAANAGAVDVTGLQAAVNISHPEVANDLLTVKGNAGADVINGGIGLATLIKLTIDGGADNDVIGGGDGAEMLLGSDGNDAIDGNRGDDVAFLGAGDDSFAWDPGDGSDVVEGQAGSDSLLFNGAGVAENFDVSANGSRVRFFRNIANITMDLDDVERIAVEALGGADNAVVNDMSGTDLTKVDLDLEGVLNSGAGDGAADTVTVNGTNAPDNINIAANAGAVDVTGLQAAVNISHPEVANDLLTVKGNAGDDTITPGAGVTALIQLAIDLGADN